MYLVNRNLKLLLNTSNFRQATTIAFICLLVALASIILSNQLLVVVMRSHVRDMILTDVRTQQYHGRLSDAREAARNLLNGQALEVRKDRHSIVFDEAGNALFGDARLLPKMDCPAPCNTNWRHGTLRTAKGREADILGLLMPLPGGGQYFSAYDLRPMLERTRMIPLIAGAGLLVILLSIVLISLPFSMRNLYRINSIRDALARYAGGDHSVRVPYAQQGDEFDRLGLEINQGLLRINKLMDEVKNISTHIAHELRTPLTRLQSRLLSAVDMVDGQARVELLQAVQDSERIQNLFRAVMRVAEVETGRLAYQFETFPAHGLLADVVEYYLPLAEERCCPLLIQAPRDCWLYGDKALLFQAMANMIDNALKYAPAGLPITLKAYQNPEYCYLCVADLGPGIAAAQRTTAIERFQRLDTSGGTPGNGLGLTMIRAIAELHGGDLILEDNQPGLRAMIQLQKHPTA
ncbi:MULTISPECIES: sensor histidine kinase [Pseudomonas]|jgi:signal transduction histidine kinase|uniref:histidine kinase n=1 Tax=Pseudomonas marginalis TaxID=298 RepID=A0A9X9BMS9_PSEMA|nr:MULTISPECIES: HAMP domain-containing sensor histidine kinase [Pseudomonas]MCS3514922.1 signal transduction histidine kinase [Pseudomonas grimontii]TWR52818.1 HAMP domain-containing histidine kinase [Pseudomonas marginalis]SEC13945.1 Signal transduction histidine kinase [Pseudomonas marginalis]